VKILLAHNFYKQAGGEDQVFAAESELLRRAGHEVLTFHRHNSEITRYGSLGGASLASQTIWSRETYSELRALLIREKPSIAHFHNLLPLISPSAFYACRSEGVPVVQTLHNYRLVCPTATLYRKGRVCEECIDRSNFAPAVSHGCYRDSRSATAAVASMITVHRALGTWSKQVDCYIALTEFSRTKLLSAGLPPQNCFVKPNFLPSDPGDGRAARDYALFVGRLAPEKGVTSLLEAWLKANPSIGLRIAGDGPLRGAVQRAVHESGGSVEWLGHISHQEVVRSLQGAQFLIFPSEWYEGFPVTLVESLACGTPVIAGRIGSVAEIVADKLTGIHFTPGDPDDLAHKILWAISHPECVREMGKRARAEFLARYTAEQNYRQLMEVYKHATANRAAEPRATAAPRQPWRTPARSSAMPAVMVIHNFYQQRGGEDAVVEAELQMLRGAGCRATTFFRHNNEIVDNSWWARGKLAAGAVWSADSVRELRTAILATKPDVAHIHNFMPLLSPALHHLCKDLGVPVVQTLHNYRLWCPSANFYRDRHVCEECVGKLVPWPGVLHKCYRQDRLASAAVGAMIAAHDWIGTWSRAVDRFIVLTEFARRKVSANGIPADKITVKPNYFEPDPGPKQERGEYALFVGRLSAEKGIQTLLEGWRRLRIEVPLLILGEGPCGPEVVSACGEVAQMRWLGQMTKIKVVEAMKSARFLVLPSECYENFPLALVEAFACGLPVIASNLGGLAELVDDGRTGLTFRASDPDDLAEKITWAWRHEWELDQMGREARREFELKYTASANRDTLLGVYRQVLGFPSATGKNASP
jgi:glycosyltransferase involved in cell wall biosynthesis